ncbi:MAG: PEP-CTERM sorting domain-containing protein [Candidatus Eisenbacteria bacterium]|nr:PEP-CTERM sorting domain-containing protein [Candidatus Eisenbacteria bacterium]
MKATSSILLLLASCLAVSQAPASLFLDDWGISYGRWNPEVSSDMRVVFAVDDYVSGANGWLDPGYGGQPFDVEAVYLACDASRLYLGVVTGFGPDGGMGWNGWYYQHLCPGDLALDLSGDGVYDYAVDVSAVGAVRHRELVWENPSLAGRPAWGGAGDPLRVKQWADSFDSESFSYAAFDGRYAIESIIELADVDWTGDAKLHWTMGCGNDLAEIEMKVSNPIPEPSTLMLLAAGLLGSGVLARRSRRR